MNKGHACLIMFSDATMAKIKRIARMHKLVWVGNEEEMVAQVLLYSLSYVNDTCVAEDNEYITLFDEGDTDEC